MTKKLLAVAAAATLAVPTLAHAQESNWVHVRVDEADGAKVRVNLPATMIDVALDIAGERGLEEDLRFGPDAEVSLDQMRRLWHEMRDAGDAEFVNVQDGDEHVRVFREGDRVFVHVDEGGTEKVRVVMPARVADALLSSEGDTLNLRAALRELAATGSQELVRVREVDGANVRIWVDDRSDQPDAGGAP